MAAAASGRRKTASLRSFLNPHSIAVVGVCDVTGEIAHTVVCNLIAGSFPGKIYPVNCRSDASISAIPETPELAVIAAPPETVPHIIEECAASHVPATLIVSAANCAGLMSPANHVNASLAASIALPGKVAFLSQSDALCMAVLDWSLTEQVGFSALISLGSMLDVGWADAIRYFGEDTATKCIVMYMETVGDPRAFITAAREVALRKPIVVIKARHSEAGTRTLENDTVLDAAFRRCGILRVKTISEVFYMAEVLGKQPRPRGPKLTIVTNAHGPGIMAADALNECEGACTLAGDAPEGYAQAVEVALHDAGTDGVLAIVTPQAVTSSAELARAVVKHDRSSKPVIASFMGGKGMQEAEGILNAGGIPSFPYPDSAARVFEYMWQYSRNLHLLYETPSLDEESLGTISPDVAALIAEAIISGRTVLTKAESRQLLQAYQIPVGEEMQPRAYEVILGSSIDSQFGPIIFFGLGGELADVFHDRALALPPLNTTLARRLMEQTKIYSGLKGRVDMGLLDRILVRFSRLVVEQPRIREITIDPLVLTQHEIVALNTRVTLHPVSVPDEQLPRSAIRPYPNQYSGEWVTRGGDRVRIRPIRPEDEPNMVAFHGKLSDHSVQMRYLAGLSYQQRTAHDRLTRVCAIDYELEMALVAELQEVRREGEIVAVGRLVRNLEGNSGEFALVIADDFQRQGIGAELLRRLIQVGRDEQLESIEGWIAPSNSGMQSVSRKLGFDVRFDAAEELVRATLSLRAPEQP